MAIGLRAIAACIGWFALALQYALEIAADHGDPISRSINFFSYFTILSNIIAATAMTAAVVSPGSSFDRLDVRTAIATYMTVTFLTYHLLLREPGHEVGWQRVTDIALHYVTPALFILDWLLFLPKEVLPWRTASRALAFPAAYMAWTLWHGFWSGFYPYPFVSVSKIGLQKVLLNGAGMAIGFLVLCLGLVGISRLIARRSGARA